jgi:phospholipase/carboxylesterase
MQQFLKIITISPPAKPKGIVVALHGWGSNADDLAALAPVLDLANYLILVPEAPFDRVQGGKMWYEFQTADSNQIQTSRSLLKNYLESLAVMKIPIFLLGFSQGAAMTLDVGLAKTLDVKLAGLICLSGYLHPDIAQNITQTSAIPPILIIHGTQDPIVLVIAAQSAKNTLTKWGAKVSFAELAMGHEINDEAIVLVRKFILENS